MWVLAKLRNTNWRLVGLAFFAVGVLHIVATLAAPTLVISRAYDQLAHDLPLNRMQVLPPVTPSSQPLPFLAPDARYALCRFDTTDGAVAITARLPGPGWMLALYTAEGENFLSSVARPGPAIDVSLMLVPSEDRFLGLTPESRSSYEPTDKTLTVGAQQGLAIIRAPNQGAAYEARNLAELSRARCAFRKT
jgi:uncharacterized membrane protein